MCSDLENAARRMWGYKGGRLPGSLNINQNYWWCSSDGRITGLLAGLQDFCYTCSHAVGPDATIVLFILTGDKKNFTVFWICVHLNLLSLMWDLLFYLLTIPGCEDIVVESLSLDSLVPILKWSSQPYGSKWVHRQALHFLCEEFSQVVSSDVLYELSKEHLLSAIQSDYLQVRNHRLLLPGASRNTAMYFMLQTFFRGCLDLFTITFWNYR